jgi:hypothetical protein
MTTENTSNLVKPAFYNYISLLILSLGGVAGMLATNGKLTNGQCGDWGMQCLVVGVLVFFGASILGFIAAIVAHIRDEKKPALTWAGFILNGLVILGVVTLYLMIAYR